MIKSKFLRHRPFLVIRSIQRPADGVRTERKDWGNEPRNWAVFEQPSVVDSVTTKIMAEATVIIDVLNAAVVKSRYTDTAVEDVIQHYLTKYRAQVVEAMDVWTSREAMKKARAGK